MAMSDKKFAFIILVIVTRISNCTKFETELQAVTDAITRRYFFPVFRCMTYVTDGTGEMSPQTKPVLLVNIKSSDYADLIRNGYEDGCSGFVVRVSNHSRPVIIANMIRVYKNSSYARYNNKRYLFLPESEEDTATEFLDTRDMYYMPNLVFVAPAENSFKIIGHNYFHGYKYDKLNITQEVIDLWYPENGFQSNEDLYPNKMMNLHGKLINFALLQYSPYTIVHKDGDRVIFDGLETRIAAQFVEASNGTWQGRDNPTHLWGDIYDNGTGNGVVGLVLENEVDMGFSAIYQWFCHVLDCSYPYMNARVTCLAPKPDMISGWHSVILPFTPSAWIAFIITYLTVPLFVFVINIIWNRLRNEKPTPIIGIFGDSFFNAFRLQLEQIPKIAHQKTAMAYFFKMWTVYCFFVAACWQGGIASFLTVPMYEESINSAEELVARFPQIHWGANHIAWIKSIMKADSEPVITKIVKEFVVDDDAALRARVPKKNFAYFVERLPNGHFGLSEYIDREGMKYMRIMENFIYFGSCVIVMTRGSPYQERLDQILHRMINSGIILEMEDKVSLEWTDNKLQTMVRNSAEKPKDLTTNLKVSHITGALLIYVSGTCFSVLVFLVEIRCSGTVSRVVNPLSKRGEEKTKINRKWSGTKAKRGNKRSA